MGLDYKKIAIIGAGASGCFCALHLLNNLECEVTIFDKGAPIRTLLPTGGGRCNLAHAEFNPKELASNYPRGEKFLYSVFSRFGTSETIETFEDMGIKTYIQENGRIFPESNSSKVVREVLLKKIQKALFVKEEVNSIKSLENGFSVQTEKSEYYFTHVVVAIGGHSGTKLVENLGLKIVSQKPSLVGLNTREANCDLSGTAVKNVSCNGFVDDLLFTHFGVSGPLIYTISSIKAFDKFPYKLDLDLCPDLLDLQKDLNSNPHKEVKNILNKYLPQKLVNQILKGFDGKIKAHNVDGKFRDAILNRIHNFQLNITGVNLGEETVMAGGIDLKEINPKTMELKKIPNLYAIGEIMDIDGFCGGFNLQNAWSTAYICAMALSD